MFKRSEFQTITNRLKEDRRFIQVVMGPRQVGKSTVVKQVLEEIETPYLFYSADLVPATNTTWISDCWATARSMMDHKEQDCMILVIDEIQKINSWSEAVKKEWDSDTFNNRNIKVLLLGSSRVMLEKGLSDSLTGRFEEIRMTHWGYAEMKECFGFNIDQYIYYGGYPGAASLIRSEERFMQYIQSSIVDSTINKDILVNTPINKPALLRRTFELGASYSGNILSLNKMVGELQDAGNTTTLAGYIDLLNESGLLSGLHKYSIDDARRRASIPKFQVYNNALKTLYNPLSFEKTLEDRKVWGHIYESAVGAWLLNLSFARRYEIFYWRDHDDEVDFVLRYKGQLVAIEVKSNAEKNTKGMERFKELFHPNEIFIVGEGGMPIEEFMSLRSLF